MKVEEAINHALKNDWTYLQLGKWLTGEPCKLTPPEATTIMDIYRRQYPSAGKQRQNLPRRERKAVAKAVAKSVQRLQEIGESLTTTVAAAASRCPSIINRSAVKAFALKVSKEKRAGKFNRVSKEFLDEPKIWREPPPPEPPRDER